MHEFKRRSSAAARFTPEMEAGSEAVSKEGRLRTPAAYRMCEWGTEGLLYLMIVFTPWVFGTTQTWAIWTMNITAYVLGGLLAAKWIIRRTTGFRPSRWGEKPANELFDLGRNSRDGAWILTAGLAVLTGLILGYTLISALNARATYIHSQRLFEYHEIISWLPHSYHSKGTWFRFWTYLGLACVFWSARDWLLGKTPRERREKRAPNGANPAVLPDRLQRLLWVICINGALLGLVAILQRLSGTNKLLWLVLPWMNQTAESQFGPYAYRSNFAQYINLVWPVCLGFWLSLRRASLRMRHGPSRVGSGNHLVLLPGAILMAACPVISTSRGGAFISLALVLVTVPLLLFANRREGWSVRAGILVIFGLVFLLAGYLGWEQLERRLQTVFTDRLSNRIEIFENARPIAQDFPLFGVGPGAFAAIYQLYREPTQSWAGYLHDDWLEIRINFGWIGFSIILVMLAIPFARWLAPGGIHVPWEFMALIAAALAGCLMHAKFDFPFRIYSIVFLFLILCSILMCLSRKPS